MTLLQQTTPVPQQHTILAPPTPSPAMIIKAVSKWLRRNCAKHFLRINSIDRPHASGSHIVTDDVSPGSSNGDFYYPQGAFQCREGDGSQRVTGTQGNAAIELGLPMLLTIVQQKLLLGARWFGVPDVSWSLLLATRFPEPGKQCGPLHWVPLNLPNWSDVNVNLPRQRQMRFLVSRLQFGVTTKQAMANFILRIISLVRPCLVDVSQIPQIHWILYADMCSICNQRKIMEAIYLCQITHKRSVYLKCHKKITYITRRFKRWYMQAQCDKCACSINCRHPQMMSLFWCWLQD